MKHKMESYARVLGLQSFLGALGLFIIPILWVFGGFGPWGILLMVLAAWVWGGPRGLSGASRGYRLGPWEASHLHQLVGVLAHRAQISQIPELWVQAGETVNAGAFLRDGKPAILLTAGLLRSLQGRELAGVIAHEMAHLKHRDLDRFHWASWATGLTLASGIAVWVQSFFDPLVLLALVISMTLVSRLTALWSRIREFAADLGAAELTGDPRGLALALRRITWRPRSLWDLVTGVRISRSHTQDPYRTHPDPEVRVRRLEALAPVEPAWGTDFPRFFSKFAG